MNLYAQVNGWITQNLFTQINFIWTLSQCLNKVIGIDQIELKKKKNPIYVLS
jgi:homoserine trans-succinylase